MQLLTQKFVDALPLSTKIGFDDIDLSNYVPDEINPTEVVSLSEVPQNEVKLELMNTTDKLSSQELKAFLLHGAIKQDGTWMLLVSFVHTPTNFAIFKTTQLKLDGPGFLPYFTENIDWKYQDIYLAEQDL